MYILGDSGIARNLTGVMYRPLGWSQCILGLHFRANHMIISAYYIRDGVHGTRRQYTSATWSEPPVPFDWVLEQTELGHAVHYNSDATDRVNYRTSLVGSHSTHTIQI